MIRHRRFHYRGNAQRLMNPAKVVVHVMKGTAASKFSTFLENPLVKRVKQRMDILIVRFCRST